MERMVGEKNVTATAHPHRPDRREEHQQGWRPGEGARQVAGFPHRAGSVREAGEMTSLSSRPLPPPSLPFPPVTTAMSWGQEGSGREPGSLQPSAPRLCSGSRRRAAGPVLAPCAPPSLTLRAVVEAVELPVRREGLQRHRQRPAAAPAPPLTQAHETSCPAPAPHSGKWRRGGEGSARGRRGEGRAVAHPRPAPPRPRPRL